MKGFDPSSQYLRKTSEGGDRYRLYACFLKLSLGATGGDDLHPESG